MFVCGRERRPESVGGGGGGERERERERGGRGLKLR